MVSVVTCTNKPNQIENIFDNYSRQDWEEKELIIILNRDNLDLKKWEEKANQYSNVSVFQLPDKVTLGECLNFAVFQAKYEIIAKFDDDDYYSPFYIAQAIQVFIDNDADIVGKTRLFTYFKKSRRLGIRKSINPIGGGTIMFRKQVFKSIKFPARNTGEDTIFLKRARKNNLKICSSDKYNYCYIRSSPINHTWKVKEKRLLKNCSNLIYTDDFEPLIIREHNSCKSLSSKGDQFN
jgi:cellulose synthase/poly-beta-1,6-N-acetylglucosamine synthase-like glycosyltransferase